MRSQLTAAATIAMSLVAVGAAPQERASAPDTVVHVAITSLLATPERYQGAFVRVVGYVKLEEEMSAVFAHREDAEVGSFSNGLWLRWQEAPAPAPPKSDGFFDVGGRFDPTDHGHLGAWPATIVVHELFPRKVRRREASQQQ